MKILCLLSILMTFSSAFARSHWDISFSSVDVLKTSPNHGNFQIPQQLKRISGDSHFAEIRFEVSRSNTDDFYYKCIYTGPDLKLTGCEDYAGNDFGDVRGHIFSIRKGQIIYFKSEAEGEIQISFPVKWF